MSDLQVANCPKNVLKQLIAAHHYSGTCSAITVGYGIWWRGKLRGGIVFSAGVGRHANAYCPICTPHEIMELTRLWIADEVPPNSESRVIGIVLRALRKGPGRIRAILSYADEYAGHMGTIYQATNFRYRGTSAGGSTKIQIGSQIVSSRSLKAHYGTHSIARLRAILGRDDIHYVAHDTRKHAYVYPLTKDVATWLDTHQLPYPKRS